MACFSRAGVVYGFFGNERPGWVNSLYNLPQPSNNLSGPIRGHVALKSSPFATTCTRLSNQGLIQDQMNTHYKKLNKAKPCIDAGPPKSMTLSVKKRDQMRREAMMKSLKASSSPASSRPSSRTTTRPDSARQNSPSRQALDQSFTLAELNHLAVDGRLSPSPHSPIRGTANHERVSRPQSRLSETQRLKDSASPRMTETERLRSERLDQIRPVSGDILDRMSGRFSSPKKLHTPRTLNTTATSRLAQSRNYNKPKRPTVKTSSQQNGIINNEQYDEYEQTIQDYENRMLEDDDDANNIVDDQPKQNPDHIRWVEDQARRVESLHLNQLTGEEASDREDNYGLGLTQSYQRPFYSTGYLSSRPHSRTSQRMKDEEEELRYLEFVTDVTNDVLNRGIFTNRVLKQVFDSHINRNKDRLDEARMRHLMTQLQEDLFIPNSDNENEEEEEDSAAKNSSR